MATSILVKSMIANVVKYLISNSKILTKRFFFTPIPCSLTQHQGFCLLSFAVFSGLMGATFKSNPIW